MIYSSSFAKFVVSTSLMLTVQVVRGVTFGLFVGTYRLDLQGSMSPSPLLLKETSETSAISNFVTWHNREDLNAQQSCQNIRPVQCVVLCLGSVGSVIALCCRASRTGIPQQLRVRFSVRTVCSSLRTVTSSHVRVLRHSSGDCIECGQSELQHLSLEAQVRLRFWRTSV
jgi:hypothetical protein